MSLTNLTFAFPTSTTQYGTGYGDNAALLNNFEAFNGVQQAATRKIFQMIDSLVGATFTETTDPTTASFRLAMSDEPNTAYAYYPTSSSVSGDSFYNNTSGWYDNPVRGNYAYATIIHELGHNLGLKHGHETGGFGSMVADRDGMEFSVMTYRSYVGGPTSGYTNETWGYAQTFMMYDIAALQHMYGADYSTNSGNTTYSFSADTGEMFINGVGQGAPGGNKIFLTIWDGGGNDTYDFSNYSTNLVVSLEAGGWSKLSDEQIATLGFSGQTARANVYNALMFQGNTASLIENANGGSGNDILVGNAADNRLTGNGGNDTLYGLAGIDTVVVGGSTTVTSLNYFLGGLGVVKSTVGGTDRFFGMEKVEFTNGTIVLDLVGARSILEYVASYKDLRVFGTNSEAAFNHFVDYGMNEGRSLTFSALEYAASYGDLSGAFGSNRDAAAGHYINYGANEGRYSWFDGKLYAASYRDLTAAFGTDQEAAARHYLESGKSEGRSILFDTRQYLNNYADLKAAFGNDHNAALDHYLNHGASEGRVAFSGLEYLASHADLIAAFGSDSVSGFSHYLNYGKNEGRAVTFDGLKYIASHGDLIRAFGANDDLGAFHYIVNGRNEGRTTTFDPGRYLAAHADLQAAFGQNLSLATEHYIAHGFHEGRAIA